MELLGYSGCILKILEKNGQKIVQKESPDESYNSRLMIQKEKQCSLNLGDLINCKVYNDSLENNIYSFRMEYINGRTLADWLEQVELSSIEEIVNKVTSNYIAFDRKNYEAQSIFNNKIKSTKDAANSNFIARNWINSFDNFFLLLENYSWEGIVKSPCHGDMTLENILIENGNLYLIDFLDSFYDTWMIDAAKLLQDTECFWSYRRKRMSINLKVRLLVFKDLLISKIRNMPEGEYLIDTIYHVLLLNMLRILPYVKDENDCKYLLVETSYLLSKMERI